MRQWILVCALCAKCSSHKTEQTNKRKYKNKNRRAEKKNGNLNEQQQLLYYNCHGMDVDKWSRDESAMCEDVDGEWCLLSV